MTAPRLPKDFPRRQDLRWQCVAEGCLIHADAGLKRNTCRFHEAAKSQYWPHVTSMANEYREWIAYAEYLINSIQMGYDSERNAKLAQDFNAFVDENNLPQKLKAQEIPYKDAAGKERTRWTDPYNLGNGLMRWLYAEIVPGCNKTEEAPQEPPQERAEEVAF